jgi:hypothetical protein
MKPRQPDLLAQAVYGDRAARRPVRTGRWKRTGLPIAVGVAIVIAVAVITDLPTNETLAGQASAGASLLKEVNDDVAPCAFSMNEANTIFRDQLAGTLTASDRSRVPSLLQDDAAACSFTSDNINDLADIEEPGSGAGRYLAEVVSLSQTWTTSDALGAIDDVIDLEANPHDEIAARDLAARQNFLSSDRRAALTALTEADQYLHGSLPSLQIPAVELPKKPIS